MKSFKRFFLLFTLLFATSSFSQTRTVGVIKKTSLATEGYTLFESLFSPAGFYKTFLIDNCGDTVHSWTHQRKVGLVVYLLENGNLLRAAHEPNPKFTAGGTGGVVQLIDWEGNLIWEYKVSSPTIQSHHDVQPMPNGNVLVLAWAKKDYATCIQNGRHPGLLPDSIIWTEKLMEIQPIGADSGAVVWEWDAFDHLVQEYDSTKLNYGEVSDHPELLNLNYTGWSASGKDWLHANSIRYNPQLDEIAMSFRTMHEIYIIDHSTTTAQAAGHTGGNRGKGGDFLYRWGNPEVYQRGVAPADQRLWAQHDCHWIEPGKPDAGKLLIFNNGSTRDTINYSSVDMINPPKDSAGNYIIAAGMPFGPTNPEWSYTAPVKQTFYAGFISGSQRLASGNTLICDGTQGRLFEIAPNDSIVWEYINPVCSDSVLRQFQTVPVYPFDGTSNWVFRAYRYAPDYPAFVGKTLTAGMPVERNPVDFCSSTGISQLNKTLFEVYPTAANSVLNIRTSASTEIAITDLTGKLLKKQEISEGTTVLSIDDLQSGLYLISAPGIKAVKFIKHE